ncbi:olfactory receptor 8K5-like [Mesoplodon densirostris]|uniref:olfactory receptor 8K5-like n=1 Tax=Mesoplodon densirostris TaxID=48708 RepID=UPI0028DCE484|nr:olfactory receptor 8K5-like [Mesoplodon densirostris]
MGQQNLSLLTKFILMGVTRHPELQAPLFRVFLISYIVTVVGSLGMIILIQVDSHLHTPMYFFIKHLAFTDLGNSTVICPEMLVNFVVDQNTISYYACATQLPFFLMFIILSAMAYDCYLAICNPLLYNVIMSQRLCHVLVGTPYLYSTFQALMFTIKIFTLTFCGSNIISHFYCDDVPLLLMLCSSAQEIELLVILYNPFPALSSVLLLMEQHNSGFHTLGASELPGELLKMQIARACPWSSRSVGVVPDFRECGSPASSQVILLLAGVPCKPRGELEAPCSRGKADLSGSLALGPEAKEEKEMQA